MEEYGDSRSRNSQGNSEAYRLSLATGSRHGLGARRADRGFTRLRPLSHCVRLGALVAGAVGCEGTYDVQDLSYDTHGTKGKATQ
jgi:hypothetical protein